MGFSLEGTLGAITGGILGGSDASAGPAGTTTKTTTEDLPQWLKDYFQSNLSGASSLRDSMTGSVNPIYGASDDEISKTINGDYLDPSTNPWLAKTGDMISGQIGRAVDSRFESAGRYGSGAHQGVLGTDIGNALTQLYGANYANERGRQLATATGAPGYLSGEMAAKFAPFRNFGSLIPNLKTSTTTEPYFSNKGAGILGGVLAGSQLGSMFGGGLGNLFGGDPFAGAIPTNGLFAGGGAMDPELAALISGSGGEAAAGAGAIGDFLPLLAAA